MSQVVIAGTLERIETVLLRIKSIIDSRKITGYPLFQADEVWLYVVRPDLGAVCPVCESYAGAIFSGDQVSTTFPYKYLWTVNPYVVLPRTHMPDLSLFGGEPCHCEMYLLNPAEAMEKRLHEEKLSVI